MFSRSLRIWPASLLLILLIIVMTGCGTSPSIDNTDSNNPKQDPSNNKDSFTSGFDPASKTVRLILAKTDNTDYCYELIETALKNAGYKVSIRMTSYEPQKRVISDLDNGKISLFFLLQSAERDEKYTAINVDLTKGLIGHRVLLIRKGTQTKFNGIQSLEEFRRRNLNGALGITWFDGDVWTANNLPYTPIDGDWSMIYGMLKAGNRGIDYFPRGTNEIGNDAKAHPELAIEQHLILKYNRDFRIYLGKKDTELKPVLESALKKAQTDGTMDTLLKKHYEQQLKDLQFDKRTVLQLKTPE